MSESIREMIINRCHPLKPIPTSVEAVRKSLTGIRVTLFDIYGTLLISGCGDIGTTQKQNKQAAMANAFAATLAENKIELNGDPSDGVQCLFEQIAADHQRSRQRGVEYPEVNIVEIWMRTIAELAESKAVTSMGPNDLDFERIALAYELQTNPVWPMPHAQACLTKLHRDGMLLGLISNAQFLTIETWRTLLQTDETDFVIDRELQYYSYQHGHAKPGLKLFELAADALARRGIEPREVLYVGNDLLNDIMPAQQIGFRTALFAGDQRSLRLREDNPRVAGVAPDILLKDLRDLIF